MEKARITKAIAVTNKTCGGSDINKDVLRVYLDMLTGYTDNMILEALKRCMSEVKGALALADIVKRIDDGWPEPQEAWMICPKCEGQTVVWTDEIAKAYGAVDTFDDKVAARMAFIEVYSRLLSEARSAGRRPVWHPSLGSDPYQRETAIQDAVRAGRLPPGVPVTIGHALPPSQPQPRLGELVGEVIDGCSLDEDDLDDETAAALKRLKGQDRPGVGEGE